MSIKRTLIGAALLVAGGFGFVFSRDASQLYNWLAGGAGSLTYDILFETNPYLIIVALGLGIMFGALAAMARDNTGLISDGMVKRHNAFGTFLEHWTMAFGMVILMVSGALLGFLFVPRFVTDPEAVGLVVNLHYVGTVLLVFAGMYHLTNHLISWDVDIIPDLSDFKNSFMDIGYYLNLSEKPPAEKYLPIQKVSYLIWAALIVVMSVSGAVKALSYVYTIPTAFRGSMTFVHELFAVFTILFFFSHLAVVAFPSHWGLLRSQVTGWIPERYIREHHEGWYSKITNTQSESKDQ